MHSATPLAFLLLFSTLLGSSAGFIFQGGCRLIPTAVGSKYGISGTVTFTFDPAKLMVLVQANIRGNDLFGKQPMYAMHVHQYGDLTDNQAGMSVGVHYAVGSADHGCPPSANRHIGDMGNWTVSGNTITESKLLDLLMLNEVNSIIGRAVVLHGGIDECNGTTGNSGARIAYCVIGIANADGNLASSGRNLDKNPQSICVFQPTNQCKGTCKGVAYISSLLTGNIQSVIRVRVQGLSGVHALHMHQYGDLTAMDGSSTGNDYDPDARNHNLPPAQRHLGDLGNIQTYDPKTGDGWYFFNVSDFTDQDSIMGRSMVIYSGRDNGNGQSCNWEGSSGDIIMACVIGIKNPSTPIPSPPEGLEINNNWVSQSCEGSADGGSDDKTGLVTGLVLGWLFFGILFALVLGVGVYRYIQTNRRAAAERQTIYDDSHSF